MQRVWQYCRANYRILAVAAALVILGLFMLSSRNSDNFERYQAMYQRGNYDACRTALVRELADNPQWHEARALLVEVEIASQRPEVALEHLLLLVKEGQEDGLSALLLRSLPFQGSQAQDRFFTRLQEEFSQEWAWPLRFYINTAMAVNRTTHLYAAVEAMGLLAQMGELTLNQARSFSDYLRHHEGFDWVRAVEILSAPDEDVRDTALGLTMYGAWAGHVQAYELAWVRLAEVNPDHLSLRIWPTPLNDHLDLAWRLAQTIPGKPDWVLERLYTLSWEEMRELIPRFYDLTPEHLEVQALAAMFSGQWQKLAVLEKNPDWESSSRESYAQFKLACLQHFRYYGKGTTKDMLGLIEVSDVTAAYQRDRAQGPWYAHVLGLLQESPSEQELRERRQMLWDNISTREEVYPLTLTPQLLEAANPQDLWHLAVLWFHAHHPCYRELYLPSLQQVLTELSQIPQWSKQAQYLRNLAAIRRPQAALSVNWHLSGTLRAMWLSPRGDLAVVQDGDYWLYDLNTMERWTLPSISAIAEVYWGQPPYFTAVSGRDFAWFNGDTLLEQGKPGATPLGWLGTKFLSWSSRWEDEANQVWYLDFADGSEGAYGEPMAGEPVLTPGGQIVSILRDDQGLTLTKKGKDYFLRDAGEWGIISWSPDEGKLLVDERQNITETSYRIYGYHLWSLDSSKLIKLQVPGFSPLAWLDNHRLVGLVALDYNLGFCLGTYDTISGKLSNTGLPLPIHGTANQNRWIGERGAFLGGLAGANLYSANRYGVMTYTLP